MFCNLVTWGVIFVFYPPAEMLHISYRVKNIQTRWPLTVEKTNPLNGVLGINTKFRYVKKRPFYPISKTLVVSSL